MTCVHATTTVGEIVDMIEGCAVAAGGPDWARLALTGLAAVFVVALLLLAVYTLFRSL